MGNAQKKLGLSHFSHSKRNRGDKKIPRQSSLSRSFETSESLEDLLSKGPIEDYYEINPKVVLGRGHYATVHLATDKRTGNQVAVKRIQISKSRVEALEREVTVLKRIGSHPNIVTLYDIFVTENELLLVLELLKGGELFDRMVEKGPYSEREASHHIRKIGLALKYLHRHGIVHRDLKPENLILADKRDDSELKIADFGLSKVVDDVASSTMQTVCGTWAYCAPEVKTSIVRKPGETGQACYTAAVDMWSVGVIMFVILGAYHPFDPDGDASDAQLWENICRGEFDFDDPAWENISEQAKDLIRRLVVVDPSQRYNIDQMLAHPWINQTASVPATPITPQINKQLKGFVKHKKGMTPKAGYGVPQGFPAQPPRSQFAQQAQQNPYGNYQHIPNANPNPFVQPIMNQQMMQQQQQQFGQPVHGYQTRSQVQTFGMQNVQMPPQPNFGMNPNIAVNMIPSTAVAPALPNLTLNTLNTKESDHMQLN